MTQQLLHLAFFLSPVLSVGLVAQSERQGFWPEITPSKDFSAWTSINYNYSLMQYDAGSVNPINFVSNNKLSQTIGLDYASYTLEYTFRLPFNTLSQNSPLSNYYKLSTGYGQDNWEMDGYFSKVQGWFSTNTSGQDFSESELNPRYREDVRVFSAGLTAFYFLSKLYRYSHAMKFAYLQNKSGFTFYSSLKQKYHWLRADSSFYPNSMMLVEHPMNGQNRMFVFENSMTLGFTGLLTDGHWFLRGLIGFGPGFQIQNYQKDGRSKIRPFISPAMDAKLSFGYKTNGLYLAFSLPFDVIFVYLPKQTLYYQMNPSFSFLIGFQMHDLIKAANQRNLRDEFQTL